MEKATELKGKISGKKISYRKGILFEHKDKTACIECKEKKRNLEGILWDNPSFTLSKLAASGTILEQIHGDKRMECIIG